MKLRRLPEIDLANITVKPLDQQEVSLKHFIKGGGGWSYEPARNAVFDTFNPADPLGLQPQRPSFKHISESISKSCRNDEQLISNLEVAELLYDWTSNYASRSVERRIPSMAIGRIGNVRYWSNFATIYGNRPTFIFLDHRRSGGLNEGGRQFAFSMMHEQIRVADPDFQSAQLLILKFPQQKNNPRTITPYTDDNITLFDIDELQERVSNTYQLFAKILRSAA